MTRLVSTELYPELVADESYVARLKRDLVAMRAENPHLFNCEGRAKPATSAAVLEQLLVDAGDGSA